MHTHVAAMAFMSYGSDPTWGEDGVSRVLEHVRRFDVRTPEGLLGWVGYEVAREDLAYVITYARDEWLQALVARTLLLLDDVSVQELETIIIRLDKPQPFSWRRMPWRPRYARRYIRRHLKLRGIDFDGIREAAWHRWMNHPDLTRESVGIVSRKAPDPWAFRAFEALFDDTDWQG